MKRTFLHCILTMLFVAVTGSAWGTTVTSIPMSSGIYIPSTNMRASHAEMLEVGEWTTEFWHFLKGRWVEFDVQATTAGDYDLQLCIWGKGSELRITTSNPSIIVDWPGTTSYAGTFEGDIMSEPGAYNGWNTYKYVRLMNVPANETFTIRLTRVTENGQSSENNKLKEISLLTASTSTFSVTYDINYEGAPLRTKLKKYTSNDILVPNVTTDRTPLGFTGWYTDSVGGKKVNKVTYSSHNNKTLYAHWENKCVNVSGESTTNIPRANLFVSHQDMVTAPTNDTAVWNFRYGRWVSMVFRAAEEGDYDLSFFANGEKGMLRATTSNEDIAVDWVGNQWVQGDYIDRNLINVGEDANWSNTWQPYHVVLRNVPANEDVIVRFTVVRVTATTGYCCNMAHFAVTKYANTTPKFTIDYDLNDGETAVRTKKYYENSEIVAAEPSRYGYIFKGWYNAVTGGTEYTDATVTTSSHPSTLYAHWEEEAGTYHQVEAHAKIQSGFTFINGLVKTGNVAVFADNNQTVQNSLRTITANVPITIKFPEAFRSYDDVDYDIMVRMTFDRDHTLTDADKKRWNGKITMDNSYYYISVGPQDHSGNIGFLSEIWLEKDGVLAEDVNFVAGNCYVADATSESVHVYGNENILYTNVPEDKIRFEATGWSSLDKENYDKPYNYYIGNGYTTDHHVKMAYHRVGGGGSEFVMGYNKYLYTFVCPSRDSVKIDVQMNDAPTIPSAATWMNDVEWTANVDIETKNSTIITAGTPMSTSDLANTVATSDVIFTGVESEQITDKPGAGQSLAEFQAAVQGRLLAMKGVPYNITINRTIWRDGYYNTLCLPFDLSAADLEDEDCPLYGFTELKQFTDAEVQGSGNNRVLIINIDDATKIEAGKPYLIKYEEAETNIENPVFENITVTETEGQTVGDAVQFKGILVPTQLDINNKDYLFVGEKSTLYWPNTNNPLRGFRAYFYVDSKQPAASAIRRNMAAQFGSGRQTPTGMNVNVNVNANQIKKLIEQGRVVIRQNGQIFDLNGRVVK